MNKRGRLSWNVKYLRDFVFIDIINKHNTQEYIKCIVHSDILKYSKS